MLPSADVKGGDSDDSGDILFNLPVNHHLSSYPVEQTEKANIK